MKEAILVVQGKKQGEVYILSEKGQTIVGRGEKCEIQLHDPSISRRHFCITKQDGKYFLQDMGSSNGTLVNGKKTLWQELNEGDFIACGSSQLQFTHIPEETEDTRDLPHKPNFAAEATLPNIPVMAIPSVPPLPSYSIEEIPVTMAFSPMQQPSIDDSPADILIQKSRSEAPFSAHKDVERISKALSTLYKISELLHSQLELKKLLESLLETVLSITNAERGCLLLKRSKSASLEIAAYLTKDKSKISMLSISRTIVNLAIDKGLATISSDAMADQRFSKNDKASVILHHIRSVMCVPLEGKERTLGAIYLDSLKTACAFDNEDLDLLTAIGRQAGLAVERTLLQETIARSEQKYRTIFQKSPFSIAVVNPTGRIMDINPVGIQDMSLSGKQDIREASILDLFPEAKDFFLQLLESGKSFDVKELHAHDKQAASCIVNLKGIPLFDEVGQVEGAVVISEDITEAKKLQSHLIQQDKMATVGLLAAGVAHEFNNIVAGMMGFAQLMQMGKKSPERLAEVIVEQCRRARELIERLLNFSRRKDVPKAPIQLCDLVDEVLQLVDREVMKNNIKLVKNYTPIPPIIAHAGELQQVFLNLIINAVQAMSKVSKEGTLTISINHDGHVVRLRFQDTGHGIPAHLLPRMFEPFMTTKEKGNGLGLAVSYNIIKSSYDGEILIESEENKGTTFTIELPLPEDAFKMNLTEKAPKENYAETEQLQMKDMKEHLTRIRNQNAEKISKKDQE